MEKLKIKAVLGSVREGRVADKVWAWLDKQLKQVESFDVELLDLKVINLSVFNESAYPAAGGPHNTDVANNWAAKMKEADGYIIITPEYNHAMPGSLLNAFNYLANEWNRKPIAIVSYGGASGGMRASESMKPTLNDMEVMLIPAEVNISRVDKAFDEKGDLPDNYVAAAKNMFAKLEWWGQLLRDARAKLVK